ncbi:hypothetical protein LTS14_004863 [Recurvomyces mirabilis]|uniref:uncharacterized protein n=1 Tax=Recurvomyces mirabilis TaxID=574656 RepID=UPI002DDF46EB|nr:hypothetical protein LTS14_004863 [Recurvomyces mirabilis]
MATAMIRVESIVREEEVLTCMQQGSFDRASISVRFRVVYFSMGPLDRLVLIWSISLRVLCSWQLTTAVVPIIFSALFGLGNIFCFGGIFTFLVECYPLYAASALAANSFARSSFAAAFPLFGVQMFNSKFIVSPNGTGLWSNNIEDLGYQWASSTLAFIALAMTPFPYLFFRFGKRLRGRSRFAQS